MIAPQTSKLAECKANLSENVKLLHITRPITLLLQDLCLKFKEARLKCSWPSKKVNCSPTEADALAHLLISNV